MLKRALFVMLVSFACGILSQAYAGTSPVSSINKNDHASLAKYYSKEAKDLNEKAKFWDMLAEVYEKHNDPEHASHCKTIAKDYREAAQEATVLATTHRAKAPETGGQAR